MDKQRLTRELWRLRVNGILTVILAPILYSISTSAYLSSYHRFVTNPRKEDLNGTDFSKVEPGLGESELLYSLLCTTLNIGSVIGGLLSGALVKCIPHWYQFLFAISLHVLGYTLYGVSYHGWVLLIGMGLAGYYLGVEVTLCFNYATEMSVQYVDLLKQKGEKIECEKEKAVRIRNYLFSTHSVGYSLGFVFGTGVAVLFSHLPIEQYRSIAWFNVACGVLVLFLFAFFFRGEGSWRDVTHCRQICKCAKKKSVSLPGPLQVFIIITMHCLSFIEMLKWAYFEALLNPILSDSFGLSMKVSSYFYIGYAIPRISGALLLIFLQRIKISTQVIAVIGIVLAITGYMFVTDWQAIPYDPCTEFSPFHHPDLFNNQSLLKEHLNHTHIQSQNTPDHLPSLATSTLLDSLDMYSDIDIEFDGGQTMHTRLPIEFGFDCQIDKTCPVCGLRDRKDFHRPCLSILIDDNGKVTFEADAGNRMDISPEILSCSFISASLQYNVCINILTNSSTEDLEETPLQSSVTTADIQSLLVLSDDVYAVASNACMNASVSNGQCHWIPFSSISMEKCVDCPPICRNKQQTLLFPLFIIGMALLILTNPLVWVPTIAIATNQTPKAIQGIVIGGINTVNAVAQSVGPVLADTLYERAQKRTFLGAVLLASLHIPFLVEIAVLYRQLGPQTEHKYTQLQEQTDSEDVGDSDR